MEEKVSVIMSTYKVQEEYLKKAIESILNQSYKNIEFIIVSDGDEENYNTIKKYNDERIKIIKHEKNMGLPYSLNEAIEISTGKYIARMDSDDISLKNRIKIQVNFMKKNKNIKICGMLARCFGERDFIIRRFFTKPKEVQINLIWRTFFLHPTVMMDKEWMIRNKFRYNVEYSCTQDFELFSRVVNDNNSCIIRKIGLNYRIHKEQTGKRKRDLQRKNGKKIMKNNISKYHLDFYPEGETIIYILGKSEPLNKKNYLMVSKGIDKIILYNKMFNKKILKKILYNRYFELLIECKEINLFDILRHKDVLKKVIRVYNVLSSIHYIYLKIVAKILNVFVKV